MWPNGRRLRISWDKQFEHMLRMSGQGVSRMLDFSRQRLPGRGLLAIFFPDAVRATSFAGVAPAPLQVCHQYGPDKDGARRRQVEYIVSHLLASGNTACFRALRATWSFGRALSVKLGQIPMTSCRFKIVIMRTNLASQEVERLS